MVEVATSFAGETAGASLVQEIPLSMIFADPDQVRREFDAEKLAQLADSIREHGVIQPIVVRPIDSVGVAPYEIIAGERRWRASQAAGRETIPAVIRKDLVGQDVSVLQILENLQRADLTLQETAAGVSKLVAAVGNAKAALQLGRSEGWVSKHAGLDKLPENIRALVDEGRVESADMAYELGQAVKLAPEDYWTERLVERAKVGAVTRAEVREHLDNVKTKAAQQKKWAEERAERERQDAEREKDPEFLARRRALEEEQAQEDAEEKARDEARAKRREQLQRVTDSCQSLISDLAPLIERAIGVQIVRTEEGDIDFSAESYDVNPNQFLLQPELPSAWADDAQIPASPAEARYTLFFDVDYMQLQKLLKSIAPNAKLATEPSAEKQGDLTIGSFIEKCIDRSDADAALKATDFHDAYVKWCKKAKLDALAVNDNRYAAAIDAAGIQKHRHKTGRLYLGVRLKA